MRVAVVAVYMSNLPRWVLDAQDAVVRRFLPRGGDDEVVWQQLHTHGRHGEALDQFVASTDFDMFVVFDADAIPLSAEAIPYLIARAKEGALSGIIQRSNHIENNRHVYVAPSVMAFSRETFDRIGRPSFLETERGDVGEELTYRAEAAGVLVERLRPHEVLSHKQWALDGSDEPQYGNATLYAIEGRPAFYHQFQIRLPEQQPRFVAACRAALSGRRIDAAVLQDPGAEPLPAIVAAASRESQVAALRAAYAASQPHTLIVSDKVQTLITAHWARLARALPAHYGVVQLTQKPWWSRRPPSLLQPAEQGALQSYLVEHAALPLLIDTGFDVAKLRLAFAADARLTGPYVSHVSA